MRAAGPTVAVVVAVGVYENRLAVRDRSTRWQSWGVRPTFRCLRKNVFILQVFCKFATMCKNSSVGEQAETSIPGVSTVKTEGWGGTPDSDGLGWLSVGKKEHKSHCLRTSGFVLNMKLVSKCIC